MGNNEELIPNFMSLATDESTVNRHLDCKSAKSYSLACVPRVQSQTQSQYPDLPSHDAREPLYPSSRRTCFPLQSSLRGSRETLGFDYMEAYIEETGAAVVVTANDSNLAFFRLANKMPDKRFVIFQSVSKTLEGLNAGHFPSLPTEEKSRVIVATHGALGADFYQRFVSETYVFGSLLNNSFRSSPDHQSSGAQKLVFISNFREWMAQEPGNFDYFEGIRRYVRFVSRWCSDNNFRMQIVLASKGGRSRKEERFYRDCLQNRQDMIRRESIFSSYEALDGADIVMSGSSTLGLEWAARGLCASGIFYSIFGDRFVEDRLRTSAPEISPFVISATSLNTFEAFSHHMTRIVSASPREVEMFSSQIRANLCEFRDYETALSEFEQIVSPPLMGWKDHGQG